MGPEHVSSAFLTEHSTNVLSSSFVSGSSGVGDVTVVSISQTLCTFDLLYNPIYNNMRSKRRGQPPTETLR